MTASGLEESYAADLVRRMDPDRFYSVLLAPAAQREALFALYALDGEIARIHAAASEGAAGLLRLKWWHEALSGLKKRETAGHPLLSAIAPFCENGAIAVDPLMGAVEAHEADLLDMPFQTRTDLTRYLDQTSGWIMGLSAGLLGAPETAASCLREAGRAWGLVRLLRMLPHQAAKGRCVLPADLLAEHDVAPGSFLAGRMKPGLESALAELRLHARLAYDAMRADLGSVPKPARAAIVHVTLVPAYLRTMRGKGFDPFRTDTQLMPLSRIARIAWSAVTNKI